MLERMLNNVKMATASAALALTIGCSPAVQQKHVPEDYEPSIRTGMVFDLPGGYKTKGSALKNILYLAALYNESSHPQIRGDGEKIYVSGEFDFSAIPKVALYRACEFADINKNKWISVKEAKEAYRDEVERKTYSP